jgi:hypothetical protein
MSEWDKIKHFAGEVDAHWLHDGDDNMTDETPVDLDNASPVMQPPTEEHDDIKPAQVTDDIHGNAAPVASVDEPGLSPAFHNSDLMTDSIDSAPTAKDAQDDESSSEDDDKHPVPANAPGQPLADMMPTDEAKGLHNDKSLTTCPICQARFTPGDPVL